MMECREATRALWPADALRVSDAKVEEALEHAERCSACERFLEADRRVARLIRASVPRVRAPRELRERLYTALAQERAEAVPRTRLRKTRGAWTKVALLVSAGLLVGVGGTWLVRGARSGSAASAFADDYLRRVVEREELLGADRQRIASFFARELGVATTPPRVPGFEVKRASICLMNGQRGGVVEYESNDQRLSYYLIPIDETSRPGLLRLVGREQAAFSMSTPAVASERGLGVATWWDREHRHALVGSLGEDELERLALLFARSMSGL